MFKTGQKVVHHSYGAGVITAIEEQMLDSQTRRYYVIALTDAGKDSQLMVPEDRVSKRPMSKSEQPLLPSDLVPERLSGRQK